MVNYIRKYNKLIQTGKIPACNALKSVYQHVVNNMDNPGEFHYEHKRAMHAINFIEKFIRLPKAKGNPLIKLELWQKALISIIFGFVDDKGFRQYQEVFFFVGRKNGKTVLWAAVSVYIFLCDGESSPELYCGATDRNQAKICWELVKQMIELSPDLKTVLKCMSHQITCKANFGKFVALSKNTGSLDGLNPSLFVLDELHAIKDRNLYDVVVGGMYSREQPLTLIASTGGYIEQDSLFDVKYAEYQQIIKGYSDGSYHDERVLPIIYQMDSKEEIADENAWYKANPNLGVGKSIDILRSEINKARLDPRTLRDLLVKQFNYRERAKESFFELSDVRNDGTFNLEDFSGYYAFGGVDLSQTTDLTCCSLILTRPNDDNLYIHQMYWIPEDTLQDHIIGDKVPYDKWIQYGYLRTCAGNIINPSDITAWLQEVQEEYGIYLYVIGYDAYNAQYLIKDLEMNFGKNLCVKVSQTFKGVSSQMYESKAYFKAGKINYNCNPIFEWCCMNTQAVSDTQGNIKPYKDRNANVRIDGYAAFLDSFCVYLDNKDNI